MKNKKGMTIIELITALILISIVLVFMLNLLITVQNFSVQNQNTSDLLVNQAIVIKALEKDINEYKLIGVSNCTDEDLTKSRRYPVVPNPNDPDLYCLKLTFDNEYLNDNEGFLVQYTYNYGYELDENDNIVPDENGNPRYIKKNVIGYKRGSNQTIRESSISMKPNNNKGTVISSCGDNTDDNKTCSLKITMPILDEDGNNYDIVATYIYSSNGFNYSPGSAYGFSICGEDTSACEPTLFKKATFLTGLEVNIKMKQLAGDDTSSNSANTVDTNITAIKRSNTLKEGLTEDNIVSTETSKYPIYMWYEDGAIYYYTEATPSLNSKSSNMFRQLRNLTDISGLSKMDVSNVTDMSYMFLLNTSLTDLTPLTNWNTSRVTNMQQLFAANTSLTNLHGLENWDTSRVTNMFGLFLGDSSYNMKLTDISALSRWDTSNVTNMGGLFQNNTSLTNLHGLENWNVSNVTNMGGLFLSNTSLTDLTPLSNWNTSNVNTLYGAFLDCSSLKTLHGLENWNVSNVTNMQGVFAINYTSHQNGMRSNLIDISALSNWDTSSVTIFYMAFQYAESLTTLHGLENWDVSSVTNMQGMFSTNTSLTDISSLNKWDTSNVTDMQMMFYENKLLTDLSALKDWNVSKVTYMNNMFYGDIGITNLDALLNWNTSNVTNMKKVFEQAKGLENIDGVKNWNTSKVTNMQEMFNGCNKIKEADISNWDLNKLSSTTNANMFKGCTGLEKLKTPKVYPTKSGVKINLPVALKDELGTSYSSLTATSPTQTWLTK